MLDVCCERYISVRESVRRLRRKVQRSVGLEI